MNQIISIEHFFIRYDPVGYTKPNLKSAKVYADDFNNILFMVKILIARIGRMHIIVVKNMNGLENQKSVLKLSDMKCYDVMNV